MQETDRLLSLLETADNPEMARFQREAVTRYLQKRDEHGKTKGLRLLWMKFWQGTCLCRKNVCIPGLDVCFDCHCQDISNLISADHSSLSYQASFSRFSRFISGCYQKSIPLWTEELSGGLIRRGDYSEKHWRHNENGNSRYENRIPSSVAAKVDKIKKSRLAPLITNCGIFYYSEDVFMGMASDFGGAYVVDVAMLGKRARFILYTFQ